MEKRVAVNSETVAVVQNKKNGAGTVLKGSDDIMAIPKIPFGVFLATYGSGGGAPLWTCTRLRGAQGSGKTTLAISAMRQAELLCWRCFNVASFCTCSLPPLRMRTLYVDAEGALDPEWISAIGVSPDYYYVSRPVDGQQGLEVVKSLLRADDMGLIIIDSIPHLLPPAELDRPMGDSKIASHALFIKNVIARLQGILLEERRRGHPCLVIAINQLRFLIGGFGNPETEAGGQAFKHWFSLGIRMSKLTGTGTGMGKIKDQKAAVKLFQRHGMIWDKERFSTFLGQAEFMRARENIYSKDQSELLYKKGSVIDDAVVLSYAQQVGLAEVGSPKIGDIYNFALQRELLAALRMNDDRYYQAHIEITRAAKGSGGRFMVGIGGADSDEEVEEDE